ETSIDGAQGILMNISGGENLSLFEVQEAADLVTSAADSEVNVIFGNVINENLKEEVIVTVIATGFDETQHQENNQPEKINRQKIKKYKIKSQNPKIRKRNQKIKNQNLKKMIHQIFLHSLEIVTEIDKQHIETSSLATRFYFININ